MKRIFILHILLCLNVIVFIGCENLKDSIHVVRYSRETLIKQVSIDSLVYVESENYYVDKTDDNSGSLYKFDKNFNLVFYAFKNDDVYPYAEYYNNKGLLVKIEGKPSVQIRYHKNDDKLCEFSFLYSLFRKSNYYIKTITSNSKDTFYNTLTKFKMYSNIGYFNLAARDSSSAVQNKLINYVSYYDSLTQKKEYFIDTIVLSEIIK